MIYTVGRTTVYDRMLLPGSVAPSFLDMGASVWKKRSDAEQFRMCMYDKKDYSVYSVEADWDSDTAGYGDDGKDQKFRSLTRSAKIVSREL